MKGTKLLAIFVALTLIGALGLFLMYQDGIRAPDGFNSDTHFIVQEGEALSTLAKRLEEEGLIRSTFSLRVYAWLRGSERKFQQGEYLLKAGSDLLNIHDQIVEGRQLLLRVTIPEGLTSSEIAQLVDQADITDKEGFIAAVSSAEILDEYGLVSSTLEGFLYPDTYLFPRNSSPVSVVKTMVSRFMEVMENIKPGIGSQKISDWYSMVVLASIVEREYRAPEEAPIISSVFQNRLRWNIPLGSCATVEYIITEIQGRPHPRRIFFSDTEIQSPFNTYINSGIPPSPIGNPGYVALRAAFFPADTDFLFFVVKDPVNGTHTFTKNMNDHLQARDVYLENFVPKY